MHLVRSRRRRAKVTAASLGALALGLAVFAPAASAATETRSFLNMEGFKPSLNAEDFGPANHYPGKVVVSGVPGTVTKVSLTTIDLTATQDLDMALVGPNGAQVMLISDACSAETVDHETFTFEDAAFEFAPTGCVTGQTKSYKPTNLGPIGIGDDNLALGGGPSEPFSNSLAVFNGISPNGEWKLFLTDDAEGLGGFSMVGFTLNLQIEPPPPAPPAPPTIVTVPVPTPVAAPAVPPVPTKAAKTGKRAAALARCAKKKTSKARQACRVKARKLPV
jgi:hypothetical protein